MYKFTNTEINNKKASEFETKSMLYLLGMRADSNEVEVITIDCFNDVTGANKQFTKLWDVQSKNHQYLPPSKIGESLSTLYDNFISNIQFEDYILFIPKLNREYLINNKLNIYGYENLKDKEKNGIEKKLIEKITGNKNSTKPSLFVDFLNHITFVEDNKKISTYIKRIAKFKNNRAASEELYESIFNDIRNAQTALKNSYIENETINKPIEVLKFNRHITKSEINTLLISRLVGVEIFSFRGIPLPFFPVIKDMDDDEVKDVIQDCNENLSRAFFDKNGCKNFWQVSEFVIFKLKEDPKGKIGEIYESLCKSVVITTEYLTTNTILYMISLIKTGLNNDN